MALWDVDGEIIYSEGSLGMSPTVANAIFVTRHTYKVPYSNVGKGGIMKNQEGKYFHTPSWTEVHPKTTLSDIIVDKKPFEELFVEDKKVETWEFKSGSSDKTYKVKHNKRGDLSCDCMGYIGHRKCKHITEVKNKL